MARFRGPLLRGWSLLLALLVALISVPVTQASEHQLAPLTKTPTTAYTPAMLGLQAGGHNKNAIDKAADQANVIKPALQPIHRAAARRDRTGGPDNFGYYWKDVEDGSSYEWIDITRVGQRLGATDDWNSGRLDLGWSFSYYGENYSSIYICSNGWASFTSGDNWLNQSEMPNGDRNYGALLNVQPFDLNPNRGGGLFYWTDANQSMAVISWVDIPGYNGEPASTFQIVLLGNGTIRFNYADNNDPTGENTVVGIQNAGANVGLTAVAAERGRLVAGQSIEFSFDAGEPPAASVDPMSIDDELNTGEVANHNFTISNDGEGNLRWTSQAEIIEEQRDDNGRQVRNLNGAGPRRDAPDGRFALFQDQGSFGWVDDILFSRIEGLDYVSYRNAQDLVDVDLNEFDALWVETGNMSGQFHQNWANNIGRFEEYISRGGSMFLEQGHNEDQADICPGGLRADWDPQEGRLNVGPDENWLVEQMGWERGQFFPGGSTLHVIYREENIQNIENSDGYQIIVVGDGDGQPGIVQYSYGRGNVIVSGSPTGHQWQNHTGQGEWGSCGEKLLEYLLILGKPAWLSWEPREGVIEPNADQDVTVTLNAEGLFEGNYEADIHILSNDQENNDIAVNVHLFVHGAPDLGIEWDAAAGFPQTYDFNAVNRDVFVTGNYSGVFTFSNEGTADLAIDGISFDNGVFGADHDQFVLGAGEDVAVVVTFNTDQDGVFDGVMTVSSNDPDVPEYDVALRAEAFMPPVVTIDPQSVDADNNDAETTEAVLSLANEGDAELFWTSELDILQEGDRDANARSVRSLDASSGPRRDDAGEQIGAFTWQQDGQWNYKAGIAYDWDNDLLFLTAYSPNWMAIVDPNNDYQVVRQWQPPYNPMGAAWLEGVFYNVAWWSQRLGRWDVEGNNLGDLDFGGQHAPTAVTSSQDLGYLFITDDQNNLDLKVLTPDGNEIATIGRDQYQQLNGGQWSRSLCWVDKHEGGQLWMNTPGHIWEFAVDTDNWQITEVVQDWAVQGNAPQEWDGLGHDKHNLIWGSYGEADYRIYDDGIAEAYWIGWGPQEGSLAAGAQSEIAVQLSSVGLLAGEYEADLHILSNDPQQPDLTVNIQYHVAGVPDIAAEWVPGFENNVIDWNANFIDLFTGFDYSIPVTILSEGTSALHVEDVSADNGIFTADPTSFDVAAREERVINFTLHAEEDGRHEAVMTIFSDDPNEGEFNINLVAQTSPPPEFVVDPSSIEADNLDAEVQDFVINLSNDGGATLRWETDLEIQDNQRDANGRTVRSLDHNRVVPRRDEVDLEGKRFAFFQAQNIWGWLYDGMLQDPLLDNNNCVWYQNGADWNNVDFSEYDAIVIAGYNQPWNREYQNNLGRLEEYVADGGALYYETANSNPEIRSPGGIYNDNQNSSSNGVLVVSPDPNADNYSLFAEICHTSQPDFWNEGEVIEGSSWLHAGYNEQQFINGVNDGTLEWYQVIAVQQQNQGIAGAVAYGFGSGTVLTVAHPVGHTWWNYNRDGMWGSIAAEILYYLTEAGGAKWITYEPKQGEIAPGGQSEVTVTLSSLGVFEGDYAASLHFLSNDPAQPDIEVSILFHVTGIPDVAVEWERGMDQNTIDFNAYHQDLFTTGEYSVPVTIVNEGTAPLVIEDISCDNGFFRADPAAFEVPIEEELVVNFIIEADEDGRHEGTMTITSNDPNEGSIDIFVVGETAAPPSIAVDPQSIEADNEDGEVQEFAVNIANEGASLLRFTTEFEELQAGGRDAVKRQVRSLQGAERIDANVGVAPVNTLPLIPSNDDSWSLKQVGGAEAPAIRQGSGPRRDVPESAYALFKEADGWSNMEGMWAEAGANMTQYVSGDMANFPINDYDVIWIREYQPDQFNVNWNNNRARFEEWIDKGGVLYHGTATNNWAVAPVSPGGVTRLQEGSGNGTVTVSNDPQAENYNYLAELMGWRGGELLPGSSWSHASFAVDAIDGIENSDWYQVIAINQNQQQRAGVVAYGFGRGTVVATGTTDSHQRVNFNNAGNWGQAVPQLITYLDFLANQTRWVEWEPESGEIGSGADINMTVTINSVGLNEGEYEGDLHILNNAPNDPDVAVRIHLHVTGYGDINTEWAIGQENNLIDFNAYNQDLFTGATYSIPLTVINEGNAALHISDISSDNGAFTADPAALDLAIDEDTNVNVIFHTDQDGVYEGELTITSDDPNEGEYVINLHAESAAAPIVNVDPQGVDVDMVTGEIQEIPLALANDGGSLLRWETDIEVISEGGRDANARTVRSLSNSAVGPRRDEVDIEGMRFAWFQAQNIWGWLYEGMLQDPLLDNNNCVWYQNGADWNNVDFSQYDAIVIAAYSQPWNREYQNNLGRLEEYVANGGALYYETANSNPEVRSPGGIYNDNQNSSSNGILVVSPDPNADNYSPFAEICHESQPNFWNQGEVIEGSSWLHAGYNEQQFRDRVADGTLEWYQVIAVQQQNQQIPGAVVYGFGSGLVMTVAHPVGHTWWNYNQDGMWGSIASEILYYLATGGGAKWIAVDPTEGLLEGGSSADLFLTLDANGLNGGDYEASLHILSNDPQTPDFEVSVMMHVTGAPSVVTEPAAHPLPGAPQELRFDPTYIEGSSSITVVISNAGTEDLIVDGSESDNEEFTCDIADGLALAPGEESSFNLFFSPTGINNRQGVVRIFTNAQNVGEGNELGTIWFNLVGIGQTPPQIATSPDANGEIYQALSLGHEPVERTLTISNVAEEGGDDLDWEITGSEIEDGRDGLNRSVRSFTSGPARDNAGDQLAQYESPINTVSGMAFDGEKVWGCSYGQGRLAALDLQGNTVANIQIHNSALGMTFDGEKLWVGQWSGSTVYLYDLNGQNLGTFNTNFNQMAGMGSDVDGHVFINCLTDQRIHVFDSNGLNEIASFEYRGAMNNADIWGIDWVPSHRGGQLWGNTTGRLYQASVDANWNVQPVQNFAWNTDQPYVGPAHDGENMWHGMWNSQTWYVFDDGVAELHWFSFEPKEGSLARGQSQDVTITFDSEGLEDGADYRGLLSIASNDPSDPVVDINITLHVGEMERHFQFTETEQNHSVLVTGVAFEGEPVSSGWEVGVFTPGGVCAGGGIWRNEDLGFPAWGADDNAPNQFTNGQRMSFMIWDNDANVEYDAYPTITEGSLNWVNNGFTALSLNFRSEYTCVVPFQAGWNLISINVTPPAEMNNANGPDIRNMMSQFRIDAAHHHVILMKNERGNFYAPANRDFNNIPFWNTAEGYQVRMDEALEGNWSGVQIDAQADVPIAAGWNMIAYYPTYQISCARNSFNAISSVIDNVILAKDGVGHFASPRNNFSNMTPWQEGKGYQINVNANVVLNYPGQQQGAASVALGEVESSVVGHWSEPAMTGANMSVLVTGVNGVELAADDQIAAFSTSGRLVGVGRVTDGMVGLAVWGDDISTESVDGLQKGEAFTLKLWDASKESIVDLRMEGLVYETDGFTASDAAASVALPNEFYVGQNFPNPFNAVTRIAFGLPEASLVSIRVFDVAGREVATLVSGTLQAGNHTAVWSAEGFNSGVYLVKMETPNFSDVRKVTLVK